MYIIRSGLVKTVLTKEQYQLIQDEVIDFKDIKIEDTIQTYVREDGEEVSYLPFKISYKDVDKNGKDKFIFNEKSQEFEQNYFDSCIIHAYGKEMRILLELGAMAPVKVVYKEQWNEGKLYRSAVCIQDQRSGKKVDE